MHFIGLLLPLILMPSGPGIDNQKFYRKIASIEVLQSKTVQAELKITDEQRGTMNNAAATFNADTLVVQTSAQKGEIGQAEFEAKINVARQKLKDAILVGLTTDQISRLGQITLQNANYIALMNPDVAAQIGMSAAQVKTLQDAWAQLGKDVANVEKSARSPIIEKYKAMDPKTDEEKKKAETDFKAEMSAANDKVQPDLKRLKKGFEDLVDKTLTEGQKKVWSELKGPAFKPVSK